jgi:bifunctional DNase/RNase
MCEMRNTGLIEVEVWTLAKTDRGSAVLLRPHDSKRVVPIFIGQLEAQSILIGMGKVPIPRPLTHDLLIHTLERLDVVVDRIEINDMQDGIYYAQIATHQGNKKFLLDSRPSDAISIAVRLDCPVYIAEFIIDETSIPESMVTPVPEVSPEELEEALEEELDITEDDLDDIIAETEGLTAPADSADPTPYQDVLAKLEQRLDLAVEQENYEEAARIRDQIQEMQNLKKPNQE